jgi:hypothetical protein
MPAPSGAPSPDGAASPETAPAVTTGTDDEVPGLDAPRDPAQSAGRKTGRVVLWPIKAVWIGAWAVPRLAMWAYDRYQVTERLRSIFFNEEGTLGLYPVAFIETGFGLNVGARLFVRDLLAPGTELRARAGYGGRFRQIYSATLESGQLLGNVLSFELTGAYEIFPKSRFFGVGNADAVSYDPAAPPIDPLTSDTAVGTRFRHDDAIVDGAAVVRLGSEWSLRPSVTWRRRDFKPYEDDRPSPPDEDPDLDDERDIGVVYDTARLLGYQTGLSSLYSELELTWDSRRVTRSYLSTAAPSTGWHVKGFAGYQTGLFDDPSDHGRVGLDVQKYIDLYGGDRVLILRAYAEGVTSDADKVPFVDLPRLGGPYFLRGYPRDRFRDRDVTLVTAEYDWSLDRNILAYLFVDAGRVWRNVGEIELDGLDNMRVGFGGGIQAHTMKSFVARILVASTIDGGIYLNFSLDPVFDARSRVERP